MKEITVTELKQKFDSKEDFQLIDVREQYEADIAQIIIDIKKKNYEKLTAVDKLNNAELKRFFTDRYDVQ